MPLTMPHQLSITDTDIIFASQVLLPSGEIFDEERTNFIKNLTSIDLQACPGSGKTTCLLAKLLVLGKHLPFEDGAGILVLSHTNAAIDEVKDKISTYSPHLFHYPNFIGTIQSFVDQFLAIPFYSQKYGHLPYRIDDEIYAEKIWEPPQTSGWLRNQPNKDDFLRSLRFDVNGNLIKEIDGDTNNFPLKDTTSPTYQALYQMKNKVLEEGYLCFDDAYFLAECYISEFPKIIELLQKRFPFVFIDEMQDTDIHQASILEKLFPPDGSFIVQRIGDQNQAIYNRRVKAKNIWTPRAGFLTLNGSKRLSESIATTIKNISLSPQDLIGNSQRQNIKPKLILFDDNTIKIVPHKFGELIILYNLHENKNSIFKAVGWRKTETATGGLTIGSYFNRPVVSAQRNKIDFQTLGEYLDIDKVLIEQLGFNIIHKRLMRAFAKLLRMADVYKIEGVPFTISSLVAYLREVSEDKYSDFKHKLYKWAWDIYVGTDREEEIKQYFIELLQSIFNCREAIVGRIQSFFITSIDHPHREQPRESNPSDIFVYEEEGKNVYIKIATIHSIKGETHTATLYLETYYYNDAGKSYESQRLINQLKGNRIDTGCGVRMKESLKMAYVGLSRPTVLLCMAVHKLRLQAADVPALQNNWEIIDLTLNT